MHTFKINNKDYKTVPFDFNVVCDLEDLGVSIEQAGDKPVSLIRAYFSLCARISVEEAGREISNHIKNGGNLDEISEVMNAEIEESDFFQALS